MNNRHSDLVLLRGGGDVATAVAIKLREEGYDAIIAEQPRPTVIRRAISFAQATYEDDCKVNGFVARKVDNGREALQVVSKDEIPILSDPHLTSLDTIEPRVILDATMRTSPDGILNEVSIPAVGIGPAFTAGKEVEAVIESKNGPNLGQVIYDGETEPHDGVPCEIEGYTFERVSWTPTSGKFNSSVQLGDHVEAGDKLAFIGNKIITSEIKGIVRGVLQDGINVNQGVKAVEIDPRIDNQIPYQIADRSWNIAHGATTAVNEIINCS